MSAPKGEFYIPANIQAMMVNQCAMQCRRMMRKKLRNHTFVVGDKIEIKYTLSIDGPLGFKFDTKYGPGDAPNERRSTY